MKRLSYPNLPHYLSTGVHCLALTKADIIQIVSQGHGLTKKDPVTLLPFSWVSGY
jgi:hypothetical protein